MTLIIIFFLCVAVGLPIAYAFGIGGVLYILFFTDLNAQLIMSTSFAAVNSFTLLAMPFFIFAGDIMRLGGVSTRLLNFAKIFFRRSRSALGTITIVGSAFFGAISGSSNATVAAIGGIMIPEMHRYGYRIEYLCGACQHSGISGNSDSAQCPTGCLCRFRRCFSRKTFYGDNSSWHNSSTYADCNK